MSIAPLLLLALSSLQSPSPGELSRVIALDAALEASAVELAALIGRTQAAPPVVEQAVTEASGRALTLALDSRLQRHAYRVRSDEWGVQVNGGSLESVMHGAAAWLLARGEDATGAAHDFTLEGAPAPGMRLVWLDVARKFHSLDTLNELLELAFLHRLTHVGLHLTDDQSVMFPFAAFPDLDHSNAHGQRAYAREALVALDRRAAALGLELVPELDIPGHSTRLRAAYPDVFGDDGGSIDIRRESCRDAVGVLVAELCDVFASASMVHIGGDESGALHRPEFPAFVHGLRDQLAARGRRTLVWEGFPKSLSAAMPKDLVVIAWSTRYQRPEDLLAAGFPVINACWDPLYVVEHYPWTQWTYHAPLRLLGFRKERFADVDDGAPGSTPIVVGDSSGIVGSMLCWWEGKGTSAVPLLRPRLAAFAESTWRQTDAPDFTGYPVRAAAAEARIDELLFPVRVDTRAALPYALPHERTFAGASLAVALAAPDRPDGVVRYALDAPVDTDSPLYAAPFTVTESTVVEAALFVAGARVGYPTRVQLRRVEQSARSLALGAAVRTNRAVHPEHAPGRVVDGVVDRDLYWTAYVAPHRAALDPSWVEVDLGRVARVGSVVVHAARFQGGYREAYVVDGSLDGETWDRLADTGAKGALSVDGGTEHAFDARALRFVRLTSLGNSSFPGGHFARLVELEVLAPK